MMKWWKRSVCNSRSLTTLERGEAKQRHQANNTRSHPSNKNCLAGGKEVSLGKAVVGCHEDLDRAQQAADVPVGVAVEPDVELTRPLLLRELGGVEPHPESEEAERQAHQHYYRQYSRSRENKGKMKEGNQRGKSHSRINHHSRPSIEGGVEGRPQGTNNANRTNERDSSKIEDACLPVTAIAKDYPHRWIARPCHKEGHARKVDL